MKAFRQISFKQENRLVWSYSGALIVFAIFFTITPVFAQWDEPDEPKVTIDVKKEYDDDGNLVKVDSVRTWVWSGHSFSDYGSDSIWQNFSEHFEDFSPRNFDQFGFHGLPPGQGLFNFWEWNESDSTAISQFEDYFDEEFLEQFNESFNSDEFKNWSFPPLDSTKFSYFPFENLKDHFDDNYHEQFDDMQERLRLYHEEHQKLIEKYFHQP